MNEQNFKPVNASEEIVHTIGEIIVLPVVIYGVGVGILSWITGVGFEFLSHRIGAIFSLLVVCSCSLGFFRLIDLGWESSKALLVLVTLLLFTLYGVYVLLQYNLFSHEELFIKWLVALTGMAAFIWANRVEKLSTQDRLT